MKQRLLPFLFIMISTNALSQEDLNRISICPKLIEKSTGCLQSWVSRSDLYNLIMKVTEQGTEIYDGLESHLRKKSGILAYRLTCQKGEDRFDRFFSFDYASGILHEIDVSSFSEDTLNTLDGNGHIQLGRHLNDNEVVEKTIDYNLSQNEKEYLHDVIEFFHIMKSLILQSQILNDDNMRAALDDAHKADTMNFVCEEAKTRRSIKNSYTEIAHHYERKQNTNSIKEKIDQLSLKVENGDKDIFEDLGEIIASVSLNSAANQDIYSSLQLCCAELKSFFTGTATGNNLLKNILDILQGVDGENPILMEQIKVALAVFFTPVGSENPIDFKRMLDELTDLDDPESLKSIVSLIKENMNDVGIVLNYLYAQVQTESSITLRELIESISSHLSTIEGQIRNLAARINTHDEKVLRKIKKVKQNTDLIPSIIADLGTVKFNTGETLQEVNEIYNFSKEVHDQANPDKSENPDAKTLREYIDYAIEKLNAIDDNSKELPDDLIDIKAALELSGSCSQYSSVGDLLCLIHRKISTNNCHRDIGNMVCEIDDHVDAGFNVWKSGSYAHRTHEKLNHLIDRIDEVHDKFVYGDDQLSIYAIKLAMEGNYNFNLPEYVKTQLQALDKESIEISHAMRIVHSLLHLSDFYNDCPINRLSDEILQSIVEVVRYIKSEDLNAFAQEYIDYIRQEQGEPSMHFSYMFRLIMPVMIKFEDFENITDPQVAAQNIFNRIQSVWNNYNQNPLHDLSSTAPQTLLMNLDANHRRSLVSNVMNHMLKMYMISSESDLTSVELLTGLAKKLADQFNVIYLEENMEIDIVLFDILSFMVNDQDINLSILAEFHKLFSQFQFEEGSYLPVVAFALLTIGAGDTESDIVISQINNMHNKINASDPNDIYMQFINFLLGENYISYDSNNGEYTLDQPFSSLVSVINCESIRTISILDHYYNINVFTTPLLIAANHFLWDRIQNYDFNNHANNQSEECALINLGRYNDQYRRNVMKYFDKQEDDVKQTMIRSVYNVDNDEFSIHDFYEVDLMFYNILSKFHNAFFNNVLNENDYKDSVNEILNYAVGHIDHLFCYMHRRIDALNNMSSNEAKQELANLLISYYELHVFYEQVLLNQPSSEKEYTKSHMIYISKKIVSHFESFIKSIKNDALIQDAFEFINSHRSNNGSNNILTSTNEKLEMYAELVNRIYRKNVVSISAPIP